MKGLRFAVAMPLLGWLVLLLCVQKETEGTGESESIPPQLDSRSRYWTTYRVYRHTLPSEIAVCIRLGFYQQLCDTNVWKRLRLSMCEMWKSRKKFRWISSLWEFMAFHISNLHSCERQIYDKLLIKRKICTSQCSGHWDYSVVERSAV
jgi:hypothetical protein